MIEPVENKIEEPEVNKPLLNIQLPAPMSGEPNSPLSVLRHNTAAQHNFQQVANVLLTIINNQKIIGMAIQQITDKQKQLEETINQVSTNINKLFPKDEQPTTNTTNK
jgi:hypothetical protein